MAKREPELPKWTDTERLHKRIAAAGVASRRTAEQMILEGRVKVNGSVVLELGLKVTPEDEVRVDGQLVSAPKLVTIAMNKPVGYVTTMKDPEGRKTVVGLLPDLGVSLKPIGRLDVDSEGLLLFTNDGELHQRLSHPSYGIEKEYHVIIKGEPGEKSLEKLRKGIFLEGRKTKPASVVPVGPRGPSDFALRITIHEGRKRQVRLMCELVGHPVISLKRVRVGPIVMRNMPRGTCRVLSKPEIESLRRLVNLA